MGKKNWRKKQSSKDNTALRFITLAFPLRINTKQLTHKSKEKELAVESLSFDDCHKSSFLICLFACALSSKELES
jgi:hypothetical protein